MVNLVSGLLWFVSEYLKSLNELEEDGSGAELRCPISQEVGLHNSQACRCHRKVPLS